mgnify:CR=1 FL=1
MGLEPTFGSLCKATLMINTFGRARQAEPQRGLARRSLALAKRGQGMLINFLSRCFRSAATVHLFALDQARERFLFSGVFLSPETPNQWVDLAISRSHRISLNLPKKKGLLQ